MSQRLWEVIPHTWEEKSYKEPTPGNPCPRKFQTPSDLWNKAVEYFEWCAASPHREHHAVKMKRGDGLEDLEHYSLPRLRYLSKVGLCAYLGIDRRNYARNYESDVFGEAYKDVAQAIAVIIEEQQLTGAAAGIFNATIVARQLGLSDKQEVKHELSNDFESLLEDAADDD